MLLINKPIQKLLLIIGYVLIILLNGCTKNTIQSTSVVKLINELEEKRNIQTCDGTIPIRVEIARQLGELRDTRAIEPLISILSSSDQDVLSSGASGCQPGSKKTYPAVIEALGQFGSQAKQATPRLTEMLVDPETVQFTPVMLSTLLKIESKEALPILIPVFAQIAGSTSYQSTYLNTLITFQDDLQQHYATLAPALLQIDENSLSGLGKGNLLTALLYSGTPLNQDNLDSLLSDAEALQWVRVKAFANVSEEMFPKMLTLLDNFEQTFPDSELMNLGAWCGSKNLEGARNSLQGKIFSILNAICTPESLAAVKNYKREHQIEIVCETLSSECQLN